MEPMRTKIRLATRISILTSLAALASCAQALSPAGHVVSATIPQQATPRKAFRVFALASRGYIPDSVVTASDGGVWFSAFGITRCHEGRACRREELGSASAKGVTESSIGRVSSRVFGLTVGSGSTLWLTDAAKTAYVFDLRGTLLDTVALGSVGGALTSPFVGPDGRTWFASGSAGIVAVDSAFHITTVARCRTCRLRGGVTAPDGNAWFFQTPAVGGFVRVSPGGGVSQFFVGQHLVDSLTAGPNSALWGILGKSIVEYSTAPQYVKSFAPGVDPSQTGLKPFSGAVYWATYGPYSGKRNILYFVGMTWTGDFVEQHEINVGACDAKDRTFFASGPTYGGDGHYYIGIGCSPASAYTTGASGYIVRL